MAPDNFDRRRRRVLQAISAGAAGAALPTAVSGSASAREGSDDGGKAAADLNLYLEGLDVPRTTDVSRPSEADLAVYGPDSRPNHRRVLEALNGSTTVAVAGAAPMRTLSSLLRDPGRRDRSDDSGPTAARGSFRPFAAALEFTGGYELPRTNSRTQGFAMAHPTDSGVLETHVGSGFDYSDRRALAEAADRFTALANESPRIDATLDYGFDWAHRGRMSSTTVNCNGGSLRQVIDCYVARDHPELVSWRFSDRMTSALSWELSCGWGLMGRNSESYRRMEYGRSYGGELLSFGPTTTTGSTTAQVSISNSGVGASWSYDIPDISVVATENHLSDAIRWEHDVSSGSDVSESTFIAEPAVMVGYPSGTDIVNYHSEIEFKYNVFNHTWTIDGDHVGSWLIE